MKRFKFSSMILINMSLVLIPCLFFTNIEVGEIGISRNFLTGQMSKLESGFYFNPPWIGVVHIDIKPMRVIISTTGKGFSNKLVQFDPNNWQEFVNIEGWRYYWWDNRFSINFGSGFEESRGLNNIFRGYAYSNKKYEFIKILKEL